MNSALFGLITRAGESSLDELRARSPANEATLVRDLAAMFREGVVELGAKTGSRAEGGNSGDREAAYVLNRIRALGGNGVVGESRGADVADIESGLQSAFLDEGVAEAIVVRPTTRGFRLIS